MGSMEKYSFQQHPYKIVLFINETTMAKLSNLNNLRKSYTILCFFLFSLLFSVKEYSTQNNNVGNQNTNIFFKIKEKIVGRNKDSCWLLGFRSTIIEYTCRSFYNYYTKHNIRKSGWYHGKSFIYWGKKSKKNKNLYLDAYLSILTWTPIIICDYIIDPLNDHDFLIFTLICTSFNFNLNIRIFKHFYFSFSIPKIVFWTVFFIASAFD